MNPSRYLTYGFTFDRTVPANESDLALPEGPLVKFRDGTLVKSGDLYYIITDGFAKNFPSEADMSNQGYNPANVIEASVAYYVLPENA